MTGKEEKKEDHSFEENLKGAAQRILGNVEIVGGILTGDPITTAEGELNDSVGLAHQQSSRVLHEIEKQPDKK